jgi:hypothetical protein
VEHFRAIRKRGNSMESVETGDPSTPMILGIIGGIAEPEEGSGTGVPGAGEDASGSS